MLTRPTQRQARTDLEGRAAYDSMVRFGANLKARGLLRATESLASHATAARVRTNGGELRVLDGPFAEAKELIAGFTTIQVRSREEALQWSRRFPNPVGEHAPAVIEVRQLYELDDFAPGEQVERFREMNAPSQK